jgi:UDP-N-acetylglucosamine acyltransferase
LAGEVVIDDNAILSAHVLVHQFCRIGGYTMVGGGSKVNMSILPYTMTAREPASYCGLNLVGLRRRGFSRETIDLLHHTFNIIMGDGLLVDKMARVESEIGITPETKYILDFIKSTENRGFIR